MKAKHSKHSKKAHNDEQLVCPSCACIPDRPVASIFPQIGPRHLDVRYLLCRACRIFMIDRRKAIEMALELFRDSADAKAGKAFAERANAILKGLASNLTARGYRSASFVPKKHTPSP